MDTVGKPLISETLGAADGVSGNDSKHDPSADQCLFEDFQTPAATAMVLTWLSQRRSEGRRPAPHAQRAS